MSLVSMLLFFGTSLMMGQNYDILIKGGHVIDAKNQINKKMDVAILDGKIAKVDSKISESLAKTVIDAKGLYVMPGLIDIHSHNFHGTESNSYLSNGFSSLAPDGFTFRTVDGSLSAHFEHTVAVGKNCGEILTTKQ